MVLSNTKTTKTFKGIVNYYPTSFNAGLHHFKEKKKQVRGLISS